jgi:hypothetical protein
MNAQTSNMHANGTVTNALALPLLEQVFGSLNQASQAFEDSAAIEPAAIFASVLTDRERNGGVRDFASLQTSNGIGQAAEWSPEGLLDCLSQVGRHECAASLALPSDDPEPLVDENDLFGLDVHLASGSTTTNRQS